MDFYDHLMINSFHQLEYLRIKDQKILYLSILLIINASIITTQSLSLKLELYNSNYNKEIYFLCRKEQFYKCIAQLSNKISGKSYFFNYHIKYHISTIILSMKMKNKHEK